MKLSSVILLAGFLGCTNTPDPLDGNWACDGTTTVVLSIPADVAIETDSAIRLNAPEAVCDLAAAQTFDYLLNCQFVSCPGGPNQLFLLIPSTDIERPTTSLKRVDN